MKQKSRIDALLGDSELATDRPYPERRLAHLGVWDRSFALAADQTYRRVLSMLRRQTWQVDRFVTNTERHTESLCQLGDAELMAASARMRVRLRKQGFQLDLVAECFALVGAAAQRTIGYRHYQSQLMAGLGLLQGRLVEMQTGEGKTFAATLPASVAALAGYPVHVVTVNDYLAQRDAAEMSPLYTFLGLGVGVVIQGMRPSERQEAYKQPIVYCTNKELAFDYLRDRVALAGDGNRLKQAIRTLTGTNRGADLALRGLYFAIVDEADSIFIDEARTPLVLSANVASNDERSLCDQALALARSLALHEDYEFSPGARSIILQDTGRLRIAEICKAWSGVWLSKRVREELVVKALTAIFVFQLGQHYIVSDQAIQIIDEATGRAMPDRSWERGLHQLIEAKEGCALTDRRESIASITYPALFRRYLKVAGMTGTGREVSREIKSIFGIEFLRIPLHRRARRDHLPPRFCMTREEKWQMVADVAHQVAVVEGRPVLIGTRSVIASEHLSAVLLARGIEHGLLNARDEGSEAVIIAAAGQRGRVTVATNMAGRGTDIRLGAGVAERGGLHVVLTEYHESRRIDRQLFGRCSRQGDPGSCQAIVSLDDQVFQYVPRLTLMLRRMVGRSMPPPKWLFRLVRIAAQRAAERGDAEIRFRSLRAEESVDKALAFSGRPE